MTDPVIIEAFMRNIKDLGGYGFTTTKYDEIKLRKALEVILRAARDDEREELSLIHGIERERKH